jgi:hypothetical protein
VTFKPEIQEVVHLLVVTEQWYYEVIKNKIHEYSIWLKIYKIQSTKYWNNKKWLNSWIIDCWKGILINDKKGKVWKVGDGAFYNNNQKIVRNNAEKLSLFLIFFIFEILYFEQ